MKWLILILFIGGTALVIWGPWWLTELPEREPRFGGSLPVLPMNFRHNDHFTVACATCHHEFIDDTPAGAPCMTCHLTDTTIVPLLEEQFHGLCMSCHAELDAEGKPSGPARSCIGCHLDDHEF